MMNPQELALWQSMTAYNLDKKTALFPFSKRLARDNNWSEVYAKAVVLEYKKFMFLIVASGHPCSPSEVVDEAWHLHLMYTRDYWSEWCQTILGKEVHHQPTKGGLSEKNKHEDWYAKTLESYEFYFGQKPPKEIWASSDEYLKSINIRKVDMDTNWVISKAATTLSISSFAAMLVMLGVLVQSTNTEDIIIGCLFLGFFIWIISMIISAIRGDSGSGGSGGGCGGGGCSSCSSCGGCGGCG